MSDFILARVSETLAKDHSLESLVRQFLEMLEMVNLNPGVVLLDSSIFFRHVSLGHHSTVSVGCTSERTPLSLHELA